MATMISNTFNTTHSDRADSGLLERIGQFVIDCLLSDPTVPVQHQMPRVWQEGGRGEAKLNAQPLGLNPSADVDAKVMISNLCAMR